MYIKYGDFEFNPWEAGLSVRAEFVHSPRGFKKFQRVQYDLDGELCIDGGQYDITERLNEIIEAFSEDDKDIGLYHDDDSPSTHFMSTTTNNLTGNQVLSKQFPVTSHGEYTSGRKFQISVGALLYSPDSVLVEHQDSLRRISNAGPHWEWKADPRRPLWGFYPEMIFPATMQTIYHSGFRTAMDAYPLPVAPLYSPPFELNTRRVVEHLSPKRYPKGYTEYTTRWHYVYSLPTFDDVSVPYSG